MARHQPIPRASLLKIPTQQRSIDMVHGIVDAGIRVLARDGYVAFGTHAVAKEANISVGSLYQYFANKEMISAAIVERGVLQAELIFGKLFKKLSHLTPHELLLACVQQINNAVDPFRDAIREILTTTPVLSETGLPALLHRPFLNIATDYFARNMNKYEVVGGFATIVVMVDALIFMILRRWSDAAPMLSDEEYYGSYVDMLAARVIIRTQSD